MVSSTNQSDGADAEVLVEEKSKVRIITLNRPRQLNALNFNMYVEAVEVSCLLEIYHAYEEDPNVKLVILKGKGRAFCAGGDVAAVVHDCTAGDWKIGAKFFWDEFTLNYILATYRKPQVFAMPETALGLFPDIGASYFLSRLPGFLGNDAVLANT
ncbi:hypothetical protein ACLOJK_027422 [Asimina triloba]